MGYIIWYGPSAGKGMKVLDMLLLKILSTGKTKRLYRLWNMRPLPLIYGHRSCSTMRTKTGLLLSGHQLFRSVFRKEKRKKEITIGCITRSEEHTSELQSRENLVCRLLLE